MEFYSKKTEGAVYRFNWVFPHEKITKKGINDEKGTCVLTTECRAALAVPFGDGVIRSPSIFILVRLGVLGALVVNKTG